MRIKVNEQYSEVFEGISCFKLREGIKPEADIIILNGFPIKEDKLLKEIVFHLLKEERYLKRKS